MMKKSMVAVIAGLVSAAVFADVSDIVTVSFSTPGPDRYADGEQVLDNECYALVWTPEGAEFAGINADGTAVAPSKVALKAAVAAGGKCPNVNFQIDSAYIKAVTEDKAGTWGVYLLDTRKYATDENGVVLTDAAGKKIVESVGGKAVNGYGSVATLTGGDMSSGAASGAVSVTSASATPAGASNLKINDIKFVGDNVYLYVSGSLSCLQYGVQAGDKPNELSAADDKVQYGNDSGEMIIIRPKKPGAQFFKVNRK